MYISIDGKNKVLVKTPDVPASVVLELVQAKADWILKKMTAARENLSNEELREGSQLYFLGRKYTLRMVEDSFAGVGRTSLCFDRTGFTMRYNPYLMKKEYMLKALDDFYREKAEEIMTAEAEKRALQMGLSYKKITFKKTAKRWGSCSSGGGLMFCFEAVKLPEECVEYLVVHELAHLVHMNHSRDFWTLVEKYIPDYKSLRKKMKMFVL